MKHGHIFNEYITNRIQKECMSTDNRHGLQQVVEDWTAIIIAAGLCELLYQYSPVAGWICYFPAVIIIGTRMRGLAQLLHQSSHGSLAKNRNLNLVLGTVCSGWFVFQSRTTYIASHIYQHHPFLGEEGKDPDTDDLKHLYGINLSGRSLQQYVISRFFDPREYFSYMHSLFMNRIWSRSTTGEPLFRLLFWVVLGVFIYHFHLGRVFSSYWLLPTFTSANWAGSIAELTEHYPLIETERRRRDTLFLSRNRLSTNPLVRVLLHVHDENFHQIHHQWPKMPFWHFKKAYEMP